MKDFVYPYIFWSEILFLVAVKLCVYLFYSIALKQVLFEDWFELHLMCSSFTDLYHLFLCFLIVSFEELKDFLWVFPASGHSFGYTAF